MGLEIIDKLTEFNFDTIDENMVAFRWLGQSGFEIIGQGKHIFIDPYLSDFLAKKYAGKKYEHKRMMPIPVKPENIKGLDYILCTHRHSDHMDPETLPVLMEMNPDCKLIAPRGETEHVINLGLETKNVIFVNADDTLDLSPEVSLEVIPSAHEELYADAKGNHYFLGYILRFGKISIYHSGDCVPYAGLAERIKSGNIDLAMLPVNGRDEYRKSMGVPGNFSFEECLKLCKEAEVPTMICHHFGMFDFNTVDSEQLVDKAQAAGEKVHCVVPQTGLMYQLSELMKEAE